MSVNRNGKARLYATTSNSGLQARGEQVELVQDRLKRRDEPGSHSASWSFRRTRSGELVQMPPLDVLSCRARTTCRDMRADVDGPTLFEPVYQVTPTPARTTSSQDPGVRRRPVDRGATCTALLVRADCRCRPRAVSRRARSVVSSILPYGEPRYAGGGSTPPWTSGSGMTALNDRRQRPSLQARSVPVQANGRKDDRRRAAVCTEPATSARRLGAGRL